MKKPMKKSEDMTQAPVQKLAKFWEEKHKQADAAQANAGKVHETLHTLYKAAKIGTEVLAKNQPAAPAPAPEKPLSKAEQARKNAEKFFAEKYQNPAGFTYEE